MSKVSYIYNYSSICKILPEMVIKTLAVGNTPIFSQSIFFIFFFRDILCVPNLKTWNSCQMIRRKVTFNPSFFLFCTCYIFSKEVWQLCQQHCRATLCVEIAKNIQPNYLEFHIPKNMPEFQAFSRIIFIKHISLT